MYSILVVDDEEWIREGIILKLNKSGLPLCSIFGAGSGKEALDIIKQKKIDILITDICMDNIGGLELVGEVKKYTDSIEFIIISGYSEFKYAEQAINLGVKGYLLKPTTNEDLYSAVKKAIQAIKVKNETSELILENEKNKSDNNKLMLENELNKLLNTKEIYVNNIIHLPIAVDDFFQLIIINMESQNADSSYDKLESIKTNFLEILNDAVIDDNYYIFCNFEVFNQLFILIWGENQKINFLSDLICKKCVYEIAVGLGISITIGASSIMQPVNEELYESAKKALDQRLIYGTGRIYKENEHNKTNNFIFPSSELNILSKSIEKKDIKNVYVILHEIFSRRRFEDVNINKLYYVYSEVVNVIYGSLYSLNRGFDPGTEYNLSQFDIIKRTCRLDEIAEYLYKLIDKAIKQNASSCNRCKDLIDNAVKYIDAHFNDRINVKDIADKFGIDANYFSTIFKKERSITFTRYLTLYRLERACGLLKETNANIQEIAESIGYPDIQYFYRVFKKEFGVTPTEYKHQK